jgi:transketolase
MDERSKYLRKLIIKQFETEGRGHLGGALSAVEILRVLYDDILRFDPKKPKWKRRDRFILSKGHGCPALYAILADKGFFPRSHLSTFCQSGAMLGGHPEHNIPGVEVSTGSLGHGLSIGVGMALALRHPSSLITRSIFTYPRVFVLMGDGETNEGSVWEAALSAGKHKLSNLIVLIDYNKMQSYGSTFAIQNLEPFADKWKAFGFATHEVDGHNVDELKKVFKKIPRDCNKPSIVICHTVKGKGIKFAENNPSWHHRRGLTDADIKSLYKALEKYA